jgi:hypothetical protein
MARRRMIDPHFWESGDVAKLSIFGRLTLVGMISKADDDGRGVGGAVYLRSTIFPYDDIKLSEIQTALNEIESRISVCFYTVDGNEYYQFLNWKKWQRVDKPKASILPPPPEILPQNQPFLSGETRCQNQSESDFKNDSENDSGLNQVKSKEVKGKEENLRACAREGDDQSTFSAVGPYFEEHIRNVTGRDIEILRRLSLNFRVPDILAAIDKAAEKGGKSAAYVESVLASAKAKGPPGTAQYTDPEYYKNAKW